MTEFCVNSVCFERLYYAPRLERCTVVQCRTSRLELREILDDSSRCHHFARIFQRREATLRTLTVGVRISLRAPYQTRHAS